MNKKLILTSLCLLATFTSAFGQVGEFTDSARSKATTGMFTSDSDNVIADDIFLIERSFFSAGFQPSLTLGQKDSMGNMTVFWAMPINDKMTVGIAGEYQMNANRTEASSFLGDSTGTMPTIPNGTALPTTTGNFINTAKTLSEDNAFNIRPVFRFGEFAISYRIYREGNYTALENKATVVPTGEVSITNGYYNNNSIWEHEIGFAYKIPDYIKFYIPIGVTIYENGYNNLYSHDAQLTPSKIENYSIVNQNNKRINLYMNPEINFLVDIGPINNFKTGLNFDMDVVNPGDASEITTNYSGNSIVGADIAEDKTVISIDKKSNISFGTYIEMTMQWDTWEDKISFVFEPILGVDYRNEAFGSITATETTTAVDGSKVEVIAKPNSSISKNTVNTYLISSIGSIIKPVSWFEFRAGLSYGFNWDATTSTTSYSLSGAGDVSTYNSDLYSQFEIYSGFGFIFGEDFFLDVYISAGNFDDTDGDYPTNPPTGDEKYDLFDIRNYGFQLTYRF